MKREKWKIELPLSLIAVTGDVQFLMKAIHDGGNILSEDSKGNNIIHDLVNFSNFNPSVSVAMFHDILFGQTDITVKTSSETQKQERLHSIGCHCPETFTRNVSSPYQHR